MKIAAAFTEFAPAERVSGEELERDIAAVSRIPTLGQLYDAIPEIVVILNCHRQIVYANQALADAFRIKDRRTIYGLRPGEALGCQHSDESPGGCGTTRFCGECGAVKVIVSGLVGQRAAEECRVLRKTGDALDLKVVSTPFEVDGRAFAVFSVADISDQKRRQVLERMFLHDVSNTLTVICGLTEMALEDELDAEMLMDLKLGVLDLSAAIRSQKELVAAENGDLTIHPLPLRAAEVLSDVIRVYRSSSLADTKTIQIVSSSADLQLTTDQTQLSRILGNRLKNALEASPAGERVLVGCESSEPNHVAFWVQNFQFMPVAVQLQIFHRSYSTKGKGRGLGTYSIKLLCERYLQGKVSFGTSPEQGTIFKVTLPLALAGKM